jgi:hypothetical protein
MLGNVGFPSSTQPTQLPNRHRGWVPLREGKACANSTQPTKVNVI